jgi:hypothetical protein
LALLVVYHAYSRWTETPERARAHIAQERVRAENERAGKQAEKEQDDARWQKIINQKIQTDRAEVLERLREYGVLPDNWAWPKCARKVAEDLILEDYVPDKD